MGRLRLSVHSNVRTVPLRHAAGGVVRPTIPPTDQGTEKQEIYVAGVLQQK